METSNPDEEALVDHVDEQDDDGATDEAYAWAYNMPAFYPIWFLKSQRLRHVFNLVITVPHEQFNIPAPPANQVWVRYLSRVVLLDTPQEGAQNYAALLRETQKLTGRNPMTDMGAETAERILREQQDVFYGVYPQLMQAQDLPFMVNIGDLIHAQEAGLIVFDHATGTRLVDTMVGDQQ